VAHWWIDQGVFDRPGYFAIALERRDADGHGVLTEGNVVQRFTIHVHEEGVSNLGHWRALGVHQHARSVDSDVSVGIAQERKDQTRRDGDGSLYFYALLTHPLILPPGFPATLKSPLHSPKPVSGRRTVDWALHLRLASTEPPLAAGVLWTSEPTTAGVVPWDVGSGQVAKDRDMVRKD
jgi:hypothetical protein